MKRWLPRLAFSFVIIGCVLIWEGHKLPTGHWRAILAYVGAACSFSLGVAGIRMRHRGDE